MEVWFQCNPGIEGVFEGEKCHPKDLPSVEDRDALQGDLKIPPDRELIEIHEKESRPVGRCKKQELFDL